MNVIYICRMAKDVKTSKVDLGGDALIINKLPGYFLIFCLILSFYFLFKILWPFLAVIFVSAVLAITFYPLYKRVLNIFSGWRRLASLVTCIIVILVTVAPLTFFIIMMTNEAVSTYEIVQEKVDSGVFDKYLQWDSGGFFYDLKSEIDLIVDLDNMDLKKKVVEFAQSFSTLLVSQTGSLLKSVSDLLLNLVIMLFALFYFFKDGEKIVKRVGALSPLPSMYESELFAKIGAMVKAIVVGVFFTAIIQGAVGGIGFAIAGIPNPVFWAVAMAFFSLVPIFGTAVIWIPASIIMAILGSYFGAIFIFLWGLLVVSSVDNFVRPYLIGGKAHTYPLLIFFVILGGLWTMGFKGIIVGPLVLMALMSFLHIYEIEYTKLLKK
ncbi:MAG: AI-2E family transporter [Patescibacteria group bacterium]